MRARTTLAGMGTCLFLLAACAGGASGGDSATAPSGTAASGTGAGSGAGQAGAVVIWAEPELVPALQQVATTHQSATGVAVDVQPRDPATIRATLPTLAPQGQGPDLLVGRSDWVGEFVDGGLLAPIDLTAQAARFRPVALAAFAHAERTYGVPISTENAALLRNTDLAPKAPASIEAMAERGLDLEESDDVDVPIALPIGPNGDAFRWYPLYSASGGYIFSQDIDGSYSTDSLGVGQAGSIRAARDLAELADQGAIDPDLLPDDAAELFVEGRAAFLIAGPEAVEPARAADVPFVVEAIPGFASTTRPLSQSLVTAQGFLLSAFSRSPGPARDFLTRTAMTTSVMDALYASSGEVPAWRESYTTASADPVVKGFGDAADASVPTPNLAVMDEVWAMLSRAQVDVLEGEPAARTMEAAGAEIQAVIDAR